MLDDAPVVPSNVGDGSMPSYNADLFDPGVATYGNGNKSWVGQSDDPFFLDLRVFDLIYGGDFTEVGDDTLAGFNVNTMALQIRKGASGVRTTASSASGTPHRVRASGSRTTPARSGTRDRMFRSLGWGCRS